MLCHGPWLRCVFADTAGGIEWNWSPGLIGHTVFTESPVHLARIATERGDIARVYEFDRFNGSVWQVDIFLEGEEHETNVQPIQTGIIS